MRIGTTFLILGVSLLAASAVLAMRTGCGAWWLLAWPASSFLAVGVAYLHAGPGLLGKGADGSLAWWRVVALLPFFATTWVVWHLLRLRERSPWHLAAPGLYVGRRPLPGELPSGVRWVVDLTAEFPAAVGPDSGVRYEALPVLDGYVPGDEALLDLAGRIADYPDTVYVHCAQGHGRAALTASAVLMARGLAAGVTDAERRLAAIRPGIHLTGSQRALLVRLEARLMAHREARSQPDSSDSGS